MIEELTMIDCLTVDDLGYFLSLIDPSVWRVLQDPWRVDIQTVSNGVISWKYDYFKFMFCHN
jgi:hypothetical protein